MTPEMKSAINSLDLKQIQNLIQNGENLNMTDKEGWTPLLLACEIGSLPLVELLLKHHADPALGNPLSMALFKEYDEITGLLKTYGAGVSDLFSACLDRDSDNVKKFLTKETLEIPGMYSFTPLMICCYKGYQEGVKILLENGADYQRTGVNHITPLMLAASKGHRDCVELLIKTGADVNAANLDGDTALSLAAVKGHASTVELLLKHKAFPDPAEKKFNYTPLLKAVRNGHIKIVEMLINAGANIYAVTKSGKNAEMLALESEEPDMIVILGKYFIK